MKRIKLISFFLSSIIISSNVPIFASTVKDNFDNYDYEYDYEFGIDYSDDNRYSDGIDIEADRNGIVPTEDVNIDEGDFITPEDGWGVVPKDNPIQDNTTQNVQPPVTTPVTNNKTNTSKEEDNHGHNVKPNVNNNTNKDTNKVIENNVPEIKVDNSVMTIEDYMKEMERKEKEESERLKNEQILNNGGNQSNTWGNSFDETFSYGPNSNNNSYYSNSYYEIQDKKITPDKTIQFTQNLSSEYPVYYDTGFYINENNQGTYSDIQEASKILAFKTNSPYVEDTNKTMIIVEGVPVIIEDTKMLLDFNEVSAGFKGENIKMVATPTRINGVYNMTEALEKTGVLNIVINDEDVDLQLKPIIKDSCVLLPLRPIVDALEGEIEWDRKTGTAEIELNDKDFKYTARQKIVTVDGKEYELSTPPIIYGEDERMFTVINLLIDETNSHSEFDTKTNTLYIYTADYLNNK